MKTAAFTVHGSAEQARRWNLAAQGEGFPSTGRWLAAAADAYLKVRARAGLPVPLSWRVGAFKAILATGETVTIRGKMAPPFAYYEGTERGPSEGRGVRRFTLVYLPTGRPLATLRYSRDCQALGAELARTWVRWGGNEPSEDPAPILDRHRRESV